MTHAGIPVIWQAPQARLAFEMGAKLTFPRHEDRHMRSAYAHALCARHRYNDDR
jgi:hypothetical protein